MSTAAHSRGHRLRTLAPLAAAVLLLVASSAVRAAGTRAATSISNQASVTFTIAATTQTALSPVDSFQVQEWIDVLLVWQDPGPVSTASPASGQVLTFLVQNLGNGQEQFALSVLNLGGDDFDASGLGIFVDSNGNGLYDAGTDAAYGGPADVDLDGFDPAGDQLSVFVVGDVPGGLASGDRSDLELSAASTTGTGAPGDQFLGAGDSGTDAVLGLSGGSAAQTGALLVSDLALNVAKSALVFDPFGGSQPVVGATLRYRLDVSVTGSDTAVAVRITDPIPGFTTYTPGTLTLNGSGLTDAVSGDDAGDVGITTPGEVTVDLGDLDASSLTQTITFDVTID